MATYYVDGAVGNDGNDGLSEGAGNAWATVDKAMDNVAAGDKVWIKASATYSESPAIDTAGTIVTEIVFEGYTSATGDGGRATIVGMLTDTIATNIMYCFKNIVFDANGANANCTQLGSSSITWRNCVFKNATSTGQTMVFTGCFYECEFLDNGSDGTALDGASTFVNCKFYRNTVSGIDCAGTVICYNCVFFSNGEHAIDGGAANGAVIVVLNCTVDGDSKDTLSGINNNASFRGYVVAANSIFYDCETGIDSDYGDRDILVYNLLNSNTANYGGDAAGQEGEVTGAPLFTNEVAGADYSLGAGSPARGAGTDYSADEMDIGAIQVASTGGLLGPNKRGGKQ